MPGGTRPSTTFGHLAAEEPALPPESELTTAEILWNPALWYAWAAVFALFGAVVGSFLNVCIYRVPVGLSPNKPKRSFCFRCGTQIVWYDNIPIFSYFLLGGKCRHCGAEFSGRYAFVEFLTMCLFVAVFAVGNPTTEQPFQFATIWYAVFVSLLIVGTFTDFDHWIIPDTVTLGGAAMALGAAILTGLLDDMTLLAMYGPFPAIRIYSEEPFLEVLLAILAGAESSGIEPGDVLWWETPLNALIGAALGAGMLYAIQVLGKAALGKDAMGTGDVKLFALIGATLGPFGCLYTLMAGSIFGVIGHGLMQIAGRERNDVLPLGEALTPEEPAEPDWRDSLLRRLLKRDHGRKVHHLPFGPWIALGALFVLLAHRHLQGWLFT